ncbi:MAG TPA: hypothetical protein VKY22_18775 [Bradyrhizobium sp.]|nr:hypothetical protein [Bradyrhizobium sp.]
MSIITFLWPMRSDTADLNSPAIFTGYRQAVTDIERGTPSADDEKLLAQSWKIFDNESARRTSIDTRAGALMPAISIAATLVTGVAFTVLKDTALSPMARWGVLATIAGALVYLIRTMLLLFVVHGRVFRNTPDPSDLPTPAGVAAGATSPYDRSLACKVMRYTISNYEINNVQSDALFVAQQTFRNAILIVAIGGTIVGWMIFENARQSDAIATTSDDIRKSVDGIAAVLKEQKIDAGNVRQSLDKIDQTLDAKITPAIGASGEALKQINAMLLRQNASTDCFDARFLVRSDPMLQALKAKALGSTGQFRSVKSYYVPFASGKSTIPGGEEEQISAFLSTSIPDNAPLSIHGVADGQDRQGSERLAFERTLAIVKYVAQTQPARPIVDVWWSMGAEQSTIIKALQPCPQR